MVMGMIWALLVALALVAGLLNGTAGTLTAAAMEGAGTAITLSLSLAGALCLWSGLAKVMERAGLMRGLARVLGPVFRRLFPQAAADPEALGYLSANAAANFLGLGNAGDAPGHRGGEADAGIVRDAGGDGRDVPPDRDEHRVHSAPADHRGGGAGSQRRVLAL